MIGRKREFAMHFAGITGKNSFESSHMMMSSLFSPNGKSLLMLLMHLLEVLIKLGTKVVWKVLSASSPLVFFLLRRKDSSREKVSCSVSFTQDSKSVSQSSLLSEELASLLLPSSLPLPQEFCCLNAKTFLWQYFLLVIFISRLQVSKSGVTFEKRKNTSITRKRVWIYFIFCQEVKQVKTRDTTSFICIILHSKSHQSQLQE